MKVPRPTANSIHHLREGEPTRGGGSSGVVELRSVELRSDGAPGFMDFLLLSQDQSLGDANALMDTINNIR
jgi:hypothetical protein